MKKHLLSIACAISLSACTADQLAGYGAELLLPNSEMAMLNQAKRQSGLKTIAETPDIDQAYFKQHQEEFEKLLENFAYYRVMHYTLNAQGLKMTTAITNYDKRIADLQQQKATHRAPEYYEKCVSGGHVYNGYGYAGSYCDQVVAIDYDAATSQRRYKEDIADFNSSIASLQRERNQRINEATKMGVVGNDYLRDNNHAAKQIQLIQQKLDYHCNQMVKKPEVKWVTLEKNRGFKSVNYQQIIYTTKKTGQPGCVSSIFIGFRTKYTHDYFMKQGTERFFQEYADKLGIRDPFKQKEYIQNALKGYLN